MFWKRTGLHLPLHTGRYVPGCFDIMTGFGPDGTFMRLYYPTMHKDVKEHKSRWPQWLPHERYIEGFASVLRIYTFVLKIVIDVLAGDVHIPAVWGGDPVESSELTRMPVIVLTHGLGACRIAYSTLCLQLSSHGFLVAALEHRDESAALTYFYQTEERFVTNRKTWLPFRPLIESSSQLVVRQRQVRAAECSRALDVLQNINNGNPPQNLVDPHNESILLNLLKDRLDLLKPTLIGHSFGGATALTVAGSEQRFKQMVILDSWLYPLKNEEFLPLVGKNIPKIFINTETFQQGNNLKVMRRFVTSADSCFTIKGTTHEHQCDSPLLLGSWLNIGMQKLDPALSNFINAHLVLRFLQQQLGEPVLWDDEDFIKKNSQHVIPAISIHESKL